MQARTSTVADSRRIFADRVASGVPTPVPLCLDALTARLAEQLGYHAGYVSGGAIGFAKAVSEGLLAFSELAEATASLTLRCSMPIIVDGAVGFGDAVHVTRMMWEFEAAGAAAVELEDQVAPKRVSHHRGVEHLVGTEEMAEKVAFAVAARQDPNFLVIARTAALRHEGAAAACAGAGLPGRRCGHHPRADALRRRGAGADPCRRRRAPGHHRALRPRGARL